MYCKVLGWPLVPSYHQVAIYMHVHTVTIMYNTFKPFSSYDDEFTVHIPSLNKTVQTPIENVFPLGQQSFDFNSRVICGWFETVL